jgi:hypothetical protein
LEVKKMSDLGVLALKFNSNSQSLRKFDEALRFFGNRKVLRKQSDAEENINRLLNVITPISTTIRQRLSSSLNISDRRVFEILRSRHERNWEGFKASILDLESRLTSPEFELISKDFDILNDIADALDSECTDLFRRMGER